MKEITVVITIEENGSIFATSVPKNVTLQIIDKREKKETLR